MGLTFRSTLTFCLQVKTWFQNRRMKQKKIHRKVPGDDDVTDDAVNGDVNDDVSDDSVYSVGMLGTPTTRGDLDQTRAVGGVDQSLHTRRESRFIQLLAPTSSMANETDNESRKERNKLESEVMLNRYDAYH